MKRITMTGKNLKTYSGADTVDGKMIALRIYPGMTVSVSDEKAERMLRDYPLDFTPEGEAPVVTAPEPTTTTSAEAKVTFKPKEETGKKPKKNKAVTPKKNKKG